MTDNKGIKYKVTNTTKEYLHYKYSFFYALSYYIYISVPTYFVFLTLFLYTIIIYLYRCILYFSIFFLTCTDVFCILTNCSWIVNNFWSYPRKFLDHLGKVSRNCEQKKLKNHSKTLEIYHN